LVISEHRLSNQFNLYFNFQGGNIVRRSNEFEVPNIELIDDYLNANNTFSEIHQKLMKSMTVSSINGGKPTNEEKSSYSKSKRFILRKK
jgi:hypothetical protein